MLAADIPGELRFLSANERALILWLPEDGSHRDVTGLPMEALIRALWVRFPGSGLVAMPLEHGVRRAHLGPRGRAMRRALDRSGNRH